MTSETDIEQKKKKNNNNKNNNQELHVIGWKIKASYENKRCFVVIAGVILIFVLWKLLDGTGIFGGDKSYVVATNEVTGNANLVTPRAAVGQGDSDSKVDTVKTILAYNGGMIGKSYDGSDFFKRMQCQYTNCYMTSQKDLLNQADAVLVQLNSINAKIVKDLKANRKQHQRLVAMTQFPYGVPRRRWPDLDNFFNWTMTYRRDSDIYSPSARFVPIDNYKFTTEAMQSYGLTQRIMEPIAPPVEFNYRKNNTKLAAIIMWDCKGPDNHREAYVEYLQKHIQIDVYGECGTLECPNGQSNFFHDCMMALSEKYKFLLIFEKSMCKDFFSFFFFSVMSTPTVVPVVMGGADYSLIAPPNSFIDVSKFKSAKDLAEYLLILDRNPNQYNSYLEWKNHWSLDYTKPYCKLCEMLNSDLPEQTYGGFEDWFMKGAECQHKVKAPWMISSHLPDNETEVKEKTVEEKKEEIEQEFVEEIHQELHDLAVEKSEEDI